MRRKIDKFIALKQGVPEEHIRLREDGRYDFMGDLEGVLKAVRGPGHSAKKGSNSGSGSKKSSSKRVSRPRNSAGSLKKRLKGDENNKENSKPTCSSNARRNKNGNSLFGRNMKHPLGSSSSKNALIIPTIRFNFGGPVQSIGSDNIFDPPAASPTCKVKSNNNNSPPSPLTKSTMMMKMMDDDDMGLGSIWSSPHFITQTPSCTATNSSSTPLSHILNLSSSSKTPNTAESRSSSLKLFSPDDWNPQTELFSPGSFLNQPSSSPPSSILSKGGQAGFKMKEVEEDNQKDKSSNTYSTVSFNLDAITSTTAVNSSEGDDSIHIHKPPKPIRMESSATKSSLRQSKNHFKPTIISANTRAMSSYKRSRQVAISPISQSDSTRVPFFGTSITSSSDSIVHTTDDASDVNLPKKLPARVSLSTSYSCPTPCQSTDMPVNDNNAEKTDKVSLKPTQPTPVLLSNNNTNKCASSAEFDRKPAKLDIEDLSSNKKNSDSPMTIGKKSKQQTAWGEEGSPIFRALDKFSFSPPGSSMVIKRRSDDAVESSPFGTCTHFRFFLNLNITTISLSHLIYLEIIFCRGGRSCNENVASELFVLFAKVGARFFIGIALIVSTRQTLYIGWLSR